MGLNDTDYGFPASRRDTTFVFQGTTPSAVTLYAAPAKTATRQQTVGFFAQDQWTVKRLTLNLGLRFDYLNGSAPAFDVPAGTWVPERHFDEVDDIPTWKDWSPRLGAVYNLFGNGKTAIKGYVGRYVMFETNTGITRPECSGQPDGHDRDAVMVGCQRGLHSARERTRTALKQQLREAGHHDHLLARPADGDSAVPLAGVTAVPAGAWTEARAQRGLFPHVVREPARDQ